MSNFKLGMDFSTLYELEELGAKFYDEGKEGDLIDILKDNNIDSFRLRLWNNPSNNGLLYGAGSCDLTRVISMASRGKAHNMSFLLDFHYSDFWCDPQRQILPKAWANYSFEEVVQAVYSFTKETLLALKKENLLPDMIQVGNEITGGMLWPYGKLRWNEELGCNENFDSLCQLLASGIRACREVCPDAELMIHLERSYDVKAYVEYFDNLEKYNVDYDSIGLSYYPFWHHSISELEANISTLEQRYKKPIYIAEVAYPFTTKPCTDDDSLTKLIIQEGMKLSNGDDPYYPMTKAGQVEFLTDLLNMLKKHSLCSGVYYWEPAWLPVKGTTWASEEARKYIHEEFKKSGNEWANQCLFDYEGNSLPGLKVFKNWR